MYDYGYGYSTPDYNTAAGLFGGFLAMGAFIWLISLAVGILMIISLWKIFTKAGKPGYAAIIPIYNFIVLIEIVGLPMWYIALFFVPFANIYAMFKIYIELAHKFGKPTGFGIATIFFSFVCLPILAFDKKCVYNGSVNPQQMNNNFQNPQPQNNNGMTYQNNFNNIQNNNMNNEFQTPLFDQNVNTNINQISQPQMNTTNYNVQPTLNQNNNFVQNSNVLEQTNVIPTIQNVEQTQIPVVEQPQINVIPNMEVTPQINQPIENAPVTNVMPTVETFGSVSPINTEPQVIQQPSINQAMPNAIENPVPVVEQPQINVIPNMGITSQPEVQQPNVMNNPNNTNMQ